MSLLREIIPNQRGKVKAKVGANQAVAFRIVEGALKDLKAIMGADFKDLKLNYSYKSAEEYFLNCVDDDMGYGYDAGYSYSQFVVDFIAPHIPAVLELAKAYVALKSYDNLGRTLKDKEGESFAGKTRDFSPNNKDILGGMVRELNTWAGIWYVSDEQAIQRDITL